MVKHPPSEVSIAFVAWRWNLVDQTARRFPREGVNSEGCTLFGVDSLYGGVVPAPLRAMVLALDQCKGPNFRLRI